MELMSSLLFCALVAHLPHAFGESSQGTDVIFNNSMTFHQMPMHKKVLLNINGPPLVNMVSDLQKVFMDVSCRQCIDCMERAIKAYKTHDTIIQTIPTSDELHEQVVRLKPRNRNKRDTNTTTTENSTIKTKRTKPKKKAAKAVTVTKYNVDGVVFALKVKETHILGGGDQHRDTQESTCRVYSVNKSFPCGKPEGESFLNVVKRKVNKKRKKEKEAKNTGATTTTAAHFMAPAFRKRQVDNSQVPDNFMPSIEDLY